MHQNYSNLILLFLMLIGYIAQKKIDIISVRINCLISYE